MTVMMCLLAAQTALVVIAWWWLRQERRRWSIERNGLLDGWNATSRSRTEHMARSFARFMETVRLTRALMAIADMETPNANATVRRMAKAAREAVEP